MAASLTESVYIYSCCLDRLISEMEENPIEKHNIYGIN